MSKKDFLLVDDPSAVDVSINVTGRGYVLLRDVNRKTAVTPELSNTMSQYAATAVTFTLSAGDYSTDILGTGYLPLRTWAAAAGSVADQIDHWVEANYDKPLSLQKKTP